MTKTGCAQSCIAGRNVVTGSIEIKTGKKRQWIAQIVDTPTPNRSHKTEAVADLSVKR